MDKFIVGCIIVVILVVGLKGCSDSIVFEKEKEIKTTENITQFYDDITKEVGNPNTNNNANKDKGGK